MESDIETAPSDETLTCHKRTAFIVTFKLPGGEIISKIENKKNYFKQNR